jgi:TPR repeat protein
MRLHRSLSMSTVVVAVIFLVTSLRAQQPLPVSTQARLSTRSRLRTLTQRDFTELLAKAQSEDREAEYSLALVYQQDRVVPRDRVASQNWMLKSAEQGYEPAQEGMGEIYLDGLRLGTVVRDSGEADRWLRLAATQDDADAQFWLGVSYDHGSFGVIDYREALRWLRKAADQGQPDAQFCLGQMYEDGEGVPESDVVAASWYRKAADHFSDVSGAWEAEVQLAYLYRDGHLPQDYVEAYMWLAIVGSSVDPLVADEIKGIAQQMRKTQIAEAQRRAEDWIERHTRPSKTLAQGRQ